MSPSERFSYSRSHFGTDTPIDLYIEVPCGVCHSCERTRMRSYMIRLLYECAQYPDSLFITLTFNDENLPDENPNRLVRLFLDRVRKYYGRNIRHWIVPEYGSLRGRIHYHGILFNVGDTNIAYKLPDLWKYGFTYIGWANERTARYITKYVTKSLSRNYQKKLPRIISSKGIGMSYLTAENVSFHRTDEGILRPYINFGSYKVPLPRYYYDKIFNSYDKLDMLIERTLNQPTEYFVGKVKYFDRESFIRARRALFTRNLKLRLSVDYKTLKQHKNG